MGILYTYPMTIELFHIPDSTLKLFVLYLFSTSYFPCVVLMATGLAKKGQKIWV